MSECSGTCSSCGDGGCSRRQEPMKEQLNEYSSVKKTIAVVSGKGGVGKSLVTSLLAVAMRNEGFNTGIIDADITGPSIPKAFGVTELTGTYEERLMPGVSQKGTQIVSINLLMEHDTDPVVWRSPIITGTVKQFWSEVIWDCVDYMFVDMPPGTGDVPLTVFQSLPLDGIVIVASPQDLVGMIVEKAVKMAEMFQIPILAFVENMSYFECPNCNTKHRIFGKSHIHELAERYKVDTVCEIPMDANIAASVDRGDVESIDPVWMSDLVRKLKSMTEETS